MITQHETRRTREKINAQPLDGATLSGTLSEKSETAKKSESLADSWVQSAQQLYNLAQQRFPKNRQQSTELEAAVYWAEKAVDADHRHAKGWTILGRIALDSDDHQKAALYFDRALEFEPANEKYLLNRGYCCLAASDFQTADSYFEKILLLNEDNENAAISLAYSQLLRGNYSEAFSRYRFLARTGIVNEHMKNAILECCEQLTADEYLPELEDDLLTFLAFSDINYERLTPMVTSLLVHKYNLENDTARIDINALANDRFFISALSKCKLNSVLLEELSTATRHSILAECMQDRALKDGYLDLVLAIALQSAANQYSYSISNEEVELLLALHYEINAVNQSNWSPDELVGALLLVAMYEDLYHQNYAYHIAKYDLEDWPVGAQAVMDQAFYRHQRQAGIHFSLKNSAAPIIDTRFNLKNDVLSPFWQHQDHEANTSYINALRGELGHTLGQSWASNKEIRVLALGCDAGYNAIRLARNFAELSLVVVDSDASNLAYAMMKAEEMGLQNIQFSQESIPNIINREQFDVIECVDLLNYVDDIEPTISLLTQGLVNGGLLKLTINSQIAQSEIAPLREFVQQNSLSPIEDNVRALRQALIDSAKEGEWSNVVKSPWFYNTRSVINNLFKAQNAYNIADIEKLCQMNKLRFLGFVHLHHNIKADFLSANSEPGAIANLSKWRDYENCKPDTFDKQYQFYCQKNHLMSISQRAKRS